MERWPVFLTTRAVDKIRVGLAVAVISYWSRHLDADLTVLDCGASPSLRACLYCLGMTSVKWVEFPAEDSQRQRHAIAARLAAEARAEHYIQTDDDLLPRVSLSLGLAVDLMRLYPDFAMVSLSLPNCPLGGHVDRHYGQGTGPVSECGAAGGVRFCRTAAFASLDFPPRRPEEYGPGYDIPLAEGLRAAGYKVGFYGDGSPGTLRATHLAESPLLSCVWADFYGGPATSFPAQE